MRLAALALALTALSGCMQAAPRAPSAATKLPGFELDGKPFCFAGANNYYAIYKPRPMVTDLLDSAQRLGLKVLRVWGMLDRGSLDGSVPNADGVGHKDGVYFQYWDPALDRPAYNDGPDGLERLDYLLAAAAERDLKLIVVLVNNWRAFGGMDQYLMWYGREQHHEFFTAEEPRRAYRAWLEHVLSRQNSVNGRPYRDDPTVLAWELANEPRCKSGSAFDRDGGWNGSTITTWAREMSGYVKSLAPSQLVSVGDEGFLATGGEHWAYRQNDGVDHAALTALPDVDFGTFHLYPQDWGTPPGFGERWIADHLEVARQLGKPTLLEEYGVEAAQGWAVRRDSYRRWNDALLRAGSAGLSWMLAGKDERGQRYPDYDGFAFYAGDPTGILLGNYARSFATGGSCGAGAASSPEAPSPFVRVRRPPERVALGWVPR
ncbi:MAG: glycoside hydrolase [Myxococcales bacterium]|nr:MAG: glycoside hydrolase [Myxococcales bacterium]